jgi:hypothetical protein
VQGLERASTGFLDTLLSRKKDHLYLYLPVSAPAAMLENMKIKYGLTQGCPTSND